MDIITAALVAEIFLLVLAGIYIVIRDVREHARYRYLVVRYSQPEIVNTRPPTTLVDGRGLLAGHLQI